MCGIAGYYSFNKPIDKDLFDKMIDIVSYRGPDDRGVFFDGNLALGHRRLSIFDLSKDGHQPFLYKDRYVIVYNGEIYNYIELRATLESAGYTFRTKTDTEVLAASYDHFGERCVDQFNGMWAFAIYDKEKRVLFCSRDRFGVKPFYYYRDKEVFAFASEIKQLLLLLNNRPRVNKDVLLNYLICGDSDIGECTFFSDIKRIQPGYSMIYNLTDRIAPIKLKRYYELKIDKESNLDYHEACNCFRERFEDSVRLRLRSDVPLGYCLSGGLDSSAITCMANDILRKSGEQLEQHSVSSCHYDKEYDEQEFIDEVVHQTGILSHKLFFSIDNLWDDFDKFIWHMDEPVASSTHYAQWAVFEEASKNGLTVMLDGQGSDEQLAGYTGFFTVRFAELIRSLKFRTLAKEYKDYKRLRAITEKHVNYRGVLFIAVVSSIVPRKLSNRLRPFYGNDKRLPFTQEQKKRVFLNRTSYRTTDSRGYILDNILGELQHLLRSEDRNSMTFSIESRVPFLDYKLVELVYSMPFEYKIKEGRTKAVLRDGLHGILPEKIFDRHSKLGFATPEDKWIKANQDRFREELEIACDSLAPMVSKKLVLNWFDSYGHNVQRGDGTVFRIICAGRWARVFNIDMD